MVLPVTTDTINTVFNRLSGLQSDIAGIRSQCIYFQTNINGGIDPQYLLGILNRSVVLRDYTQTIQAKPAAFLTNLQTRYRQELADNTFDLTAQFGAMITALGNMIQAIRTDYPRDAQNHPLDRIVAADGTVSPVLMTAASLPTALPAITAWLATIQ